MQRDTERNELTTAWNNQDQRKKRANIRIKNQLGSSKICPTFSPARVSHMGLHGQGVNGNLITFLLASHRRFGLYPGQQNTPYVASFCCSVSLYFSSSHPIPISPSWWDFLIFLANALPMPYSVYFFQHTIASSLKVLYTLLSFSRYLHCSQFRLFFNPPHMSIISISLFFNPPIFGSISLQTALITLCLPVSAVMLLGTKNSRGMGLTTAVTPHGSFF